MRIWQQPLLNESSEGRRMTEKMSSWSISTKVWDRPGIQLATHNSYIHVTLRFQIWATHAYWSPNVSRLTQTPPSPQQEHPHTHTHTTTTTSGAPHIDIQGDVRIIFDKPRWSPHSLKSFTINRCVCKHNVTTRIFLKTTTVCAMIKRFFSWQAKVWIWVRIEFI